MLSVIYCSAIIWRFRLSSICAILIAASPDSVVGSALQDVVALLASMDLVLGELDR